jgi:hypothetical protein
MIIILLVMTLALVVGFFLVWRELYLLRIGDHSLFPKRRKPARRKL